MEDMVGISGRLTACILMWFAADAALAEVQHYQVRRLVLYQSECGPSAISEAQLQEDQTIRFSVQCRNTTAYPDGLTVQCQDPEDERSCAITVKARSFDLLNSMRPEQ